MAFTKLDSRKLTMAELDAHYEHQNGRETISGKTISRRNAVKILVAAPTLAYGFQPTQALSQSAFGLTPQNYGSIIPVSPISSLLNAQFAAPVAVSQLSYIVSDFVNALLRLYNPTRNTIYNPVRVQMGSTLRGVTHDAHAHFEIEPESEITVGHNGFQVLPSNAGASFYAARSKSEASASGFQAISA